MTARFRSDTFFRVAILPSNLQVTLDHLRSSAKASPTGQCAKFVRLALQAGGFKLVHQPISAKDYGPTLAAAGFVAHDLSDDVLTGRWSCKSYQATAGDIAVIPPVQGAGPHGHIAMYDGTDWYSDFRQLDMWGGPAYRKHKPKVQLFKLSQ